MLILKQVDVSAQDRLGWAPVGLQGLRCPSAGAGPPLCWQVGVLSSGLPPRHVALGRDAVLTALPALTCTPPLHVSHGCTEVGLG